MVVVVVVVDVDGVLVDVEVEVDVEGRGGCCDRSAHRVLGSVVWFNLRMESLRGKRRGGKRKKGKNATGNQKYESTRIYIYINWRGHLQTYCVFCFRITLRSCSFVVEMCLVSIIVVSLWACTAGGVVYIRISLH